MTRIRIVQWSDIHFSSSPLAKLSPGEAMERATTAVVKDFGAHEVVLALTGDITFQGSAGGYAEALRSLTSAKDKLNITATVTCPGNHDISGSSQREFDAFNKFAFAATRDPNQFWDHDHAVSIARVAEYSLILVNSAFEGDHRFGSVPLKQLRLALEASRGDHSIVFIHHSPISSKYAGGGLADAYDLLALVSEFQVAAIFHGHVHSNQALEIGPHRTVLYGVGSLGFEPDPNMNNQFAVHEVVDGVLDRTHLYRYFLASEQFERVV